MSDREECAQCYREIRGGDRRVRNGTVYCSECVFAEAEAQAEAERDRIHGA